MSDYVFFSFFRISVYLLVLLLWALTLWLKEPKLNKWFSPHRPSQCTHGTRGIETSQQL